MKPRLNTLLAVAALTVLPTCLMAESPSSGKTPYTINSTYLVAISPGFSSPGLQPPSGPVTIIDETEGWVKIQFAVSKNERSKADPGKVEAVETVYKAWVNLDHIIAFVEASAKP